mmetsp:Transcript_13543/g.24040  ORF Transcript_13543/g.24040 Transcript_13543/m.24040 type:complete len:356 (-) Transcript_13543:280-1347(-)
MHLPRLHERVRRPPDGRQLLAHRVFQAEAGLRLFLHRPHFSHPRRRLLRLPSALRPEKVSLEPSALAAEAQIAQARLRWVLRLLPSRVGAVWGVDRGGPLLSVQPLDAGRRDGRLPRPHVLVPQLPLQTHRYLQVPPGCGRLPHGRHPGQLFLYPHRTNHQSGARLAGHQGRHGVGEFDGGDIQRDRPPHHQPPKRVHHHRQHSARCVGCAGGGGAGDECVGGDASTVALHHLRCRPHRRRVAGAKPVGPGHFVSVRRHRSASGKDSGADGDRGGGVRAVPRDQRLDAGAGRQLPDRRGARLQHRPRLRRLRPPAHPRTIQNTCEEDQTRRHRATVHRRCAPRDGLQRGGNPAKD